MLLISLCYATITMPTSKFHHLIWKQKNHWLPTLLAVVFVLVSVLGVYFGMEQHFAPEMMNKKMATCPAMATQSALCPMNITDYITAWQQLLAAIPVNEFSKLLILLAFGLAGVCLKLWQRIRASPDLLWRYCRRLERQHPQQRLYNYLLSAFSQGIIQPKIYA